MSLKTMKKTQCVNCKIRSSGGKNPLILFFLFFMGLWTAQAQTLPQFQQDTERNENIEVRVDTTVIRIGEEIIYSIDVKADPADRIVFQDGQTFEPMEVIESYEVDTVMVHDTYRLIKKYGITRFDSGRYTIPPQQLLINEKLFFTDSLHVEVRDVVVDTLRQKMFDIKPAMEVGSPAINWRQVLIWGLPLLLAVILGIYFLRRKQKEAAEKQLPPYEEAIVSLKQLDELPYLKENKSKEYYSFLIEIIKKYLDREVDEAALESTSKELIQRLYLLKDSGRFEFDSGTLQKLDEIFKRADLVKFAKMHQDSNQAQTDRNSIEEIINLIQETIPEPTEEELLQNQEYLEKLRRKQKQKKWIWGISSVLLILLISGILYGSITGFDNLKDKVFGNRLRTLSEQVWIKSEYGYPAVVIETPEVLVRTETDSEEPAGRDQFVFGELKSPLYIMVSTSRTGSTDLDQELDRALSRLEEAGARNMLVKRDDFETDQNVRGLKAWGEFNLLVSDTRVLKKKSSYELFIFAQANGIQEVLIVYQDDGNYAETIKERIEASIELQISN